MHPLELILINGDLKGGTTKPLEIWATDEYSNAGKYVVKNFRYDAVDNYSTAKEIIACEIAMKFDIPVPDYAIINISDEDLKGYYNEFEMARLKNGYKFCSKFVEQCAMFNPLVSNDFLNQYEIENVFAFDVLMHNSDRGGYRNKPNLLINDNELMMIDHELTLPFINSIASEPNYEKSLQNYRYFNHILIDHVKSIATKNHIFEEFLEILHRINFEALHAVFDDMDKYEIAYGNRNDYLHYFIWCKQNVETLRKYLLLMIK